MRLAPFRATTVRRLTDESVCPTLRGCCGTGAFACQPILRQRISALVSNLAMMVLASPLLHACVIGGTVLDADSAKPLPHTRVFARPFGAEGTPAVLRVTDPQGVFCFQQLAPNTYEVVAEKAGYLVSVYGARPGSDDGIPFEVGAQAELSPLTIRMLAGAVIGGTALDPEGAPLADVNVQLSRKVWDKVWSSDHVSDTRTDERGVFRFSMLPPGTYYLSVAPREGDERGMMLDEKGRPIHHDEVETFYAGSYSFARATPIPLKAGEEINLALAANRPVSRHFSGRLSPELLPAHPEYVGISMELSIEGSMGDSIFFSIGKDGTFSADGLAPAEYRFSANNVDPDASGSVDLTGGDVTGYIIEPHPTVDLQISARIEGRERPARVGLLALNIENSEGLSGHLDETGVCHFHHLPAGIYRFEPERQGPDPGLYVKRVLIEGRPQAEAWLDLRKTAPASVELVLGAKSAEIDGRLDPRKGETHALAITVVAVDETRSGAVQRYETTVADHTGDFSLGDLAPGKWRVFAIEGFDEGPWGSPELAQALREKSVSVELREARTSSLKLPVIGSDEWEAALREVGM